MSSPQIRTILEYLLSGKKLTKEIMREIELNEGQIGIKTEALTDEQVGNFEKHVRVWKNIIEHVYFITTLKMYTTIDFDLEMAGYCVCYDHSEFAINKIDGNKHCNPPLALAWAFQLGLNIESFEEIVCSELELIGEWKVPQKYSFNTDVRPYVPFWGTCATTKTIHDNQKVILERFPEIKNIVDIPDNFINI